MWAPPAYNLSHSEHSAPHASQELMLIGYYRRLAETRVRWDMEKKINKKKTEESRPIKSLIKSARTCGNGAAVSGCYLICKV